jgi:hypothetical protein
LVSHHGRPIILSHARIGLKPKTHKVWFFILVCWLISLLLRDGFRPNFVILVCFNLSILVYSFGDIYCHCQIWYYRLIQFQNMKQHQDVLILMHSLCLFCQFDITDCGYYRKEYGLVIYIYIWKTANKISFWHSIADGGGSSKVEICWNKGRGQI